MTVRPWSEKIWFSPCYVIRELSRAAAEGENLKRYKEAWVCALAVICHSKQRPAEWWIQVPKNDPPDVLAMNLIENKDSKGQLLSQISVEIFEISSFDEHENIEKSIERKLDKKDYSETTLIAFVRRKVPFDHFSVAEYIQKLKPKIQVLFLIVFEENGTNVSLIQLFPQCVKFKADFGLFCKTTNQRDFIELSRGTKVIRVDNTTNDIMTLIPE